MKKNKRSKKLQGIIDFCYKWHSKYCGYLDQDNNKTPFEEIYLIENKEYKENGQLCENDFRYLTSLLTGDYKKQNWLFELLEENKQLKASLDKLHFSIEHEEHSLLVERDELKEENKQLKEENTKLQNEIARLTHQTNYYCICQKCGGIKQVEQDPYYNI